MDRIKVLSLAVVAAASMFVVGCESTGSKASSKPEAPAIAKAPAEAAAPKVAAAPVAYADLGQALKLTDADNIPVGKVLASPEEYNHKVVRVTGKVMGTCDDGGCWFSLGDSSTKEIIFIKFQEAQEGRVVPKDAPGHEAVLEGEFTIGSMSEQFARHLKEDAGASEEEVKKIVGPQKIYTVKNVAVRMYGVKSTGNVAQQ